MSLLQPEGNLKTVTPHFLQHCLLSDSRFLSVQLYDFLSDHNVEKIMCDSGVQRFDVINSSASIAMPAVIKGVDEVGNHQA